MQVWKSSRNSGSYPQRKRRRYEEIVTLQETKTEVSHMTSSVNSEALNASEERAPEGTGVIAGGPARAVIEFAGIKKHPYKMYGFQK